MIDITQKATYCKTDVSRSTFYHGDCLEVLPILPSNSIDLIYCDVPFGTTQCSWDNVINFERMWQQVNRLAKQNAPIVFHSQQPFTSNLIMSNPKMFKYTWVWEKSKATGFLNAKKRPMVAHEDIIVFCKETPVYYPQMTEGIAYNKGVRKQQTMDLDTHQQFNFFNKNGEGKTNCIAHKNLWNLLNG